MQPGKPKASFCYRTLGSDGYVVEIYLPKKHKQKLNHILKDELRFGQLQPYIEGYSIYNVTGAFKASGGRIYRELTTVVRIFFDEASLTDPDGDYADAQAETLTKLGQKVKSLLQRLAESTRGQEQELWITRGRAHLYKSVRLPLAKQKKGT